jgi:hypothetical protein
MSQEKLETDAVKVISYAIKYHTLIKETAFWNKTLQNKCFFAVL